MVASVASLSEGNPLFVAQLVANYLETRERPTDIGIKSGIHQAMAARLNRLDPEVRAVAETAAMLGEFFRADVLAAAGGWDESGKRALVAAG